MRRPTPRRGSPTTEIEPAPRSRAISTPARQRLSGRQPGAGPQRPDAGRHALRCRRALERRRRRGFDGDGARFRSDPDAPKSRLPTTSTRSSASPPRDPRRAPHRRRPDRRHRRGRLPRASRRRAWPSGSARARRRSSAVLGIIQTFDPPGIGARNLAECLRHPAPRARPVRSRHAGAGRPSRPPGQARSSGPAAPLRRRRRGSRRHAGRDPRSSTRSPAARSAAAPVEALVPDVLVRPAPDGELDRRAQCRHAAARPGQPDLLRARVDDGRGTRPTRPS